MAISKNKILSVIFAPLGNAQTSLALLSLIAKIRPAKRVLKKLPALRDRELKCHPSTIAQGKKCQIASLIKVSNS